MKRSRPVSLALVGLFVWVTACASYTQIQLSDISNHDVVRVTTTTGERRTYTLPRVEAERVVGQNERSTPVAQVASLEAVGTDEVATLALAAGVVLVGAAIGLAIWAASDPCFGLSC